MQGRYLLSRLAEACRVSGAVYASRIAFKNWFIPYGPDKELFSLFEDVLLLSDKALAKERSWFDEYKAVTNNASPTTGWIAYHLLRDDFPDAEVVLVNFKPDGDNGSYKWQKHDWHYEAEYYHKHEVPIRILF